MRKIFSDSFGFAVLELIISAAVLSILFAAAAPRMIWNGDAFSLDFEAANLASEIQDFRETIMTRSHNHADFPGLSSTSAPKFVISRKGYHIIVNGRTAKDRRYLPEGMTLSASGEVKFTDYGNGIPLTIVMRAGQETRYVIIDLAGRVRVSKEPPKS